MREVLAGRQYRRIACFTVLLWLAGFAWLNGAMMAAGRFYNGAGLWADLPYCLFTVLLALALQAWLLRSLGWPASVRRVGTGAAIVACALASGLADTATNFWSARQYVPHGQGGGIGDWLRASFLYGWVYGLNVAVVLLLAAADAARAQAAELARANEAAQTARLSMLRYQLNPHFLFNTLNAVSSLVVTRQNDRAEQMIDRLAAFLRSTAGSDPADLVTLAEELAVTEDYLGVEAIRFTERLEVNFAIAADAGALLVPSFLIQPIVENAIKYAVAPSRTPVTVTVAAAMVGGRLVVTVTDDGSGGLVAGGTGVGMANVRARLAAFFGEDGRCEAGPIGRGYRVTLTMPARRKGG